MTQEFLLLPAFGTQFLVKAFLVLFLVFYFFFSILLIRQVQIMTQALKTDINRLLKLGTFANLIIALIFLVISVFV